MLKGLELYKAWTGYLKRRKMYGEYLYIISRPSNRKSFTESINDTLSVNRLRNLTQMIDIKEFWRTLALGVKWKKVFYEFIIQYYKDVYGEARVKVMLNRLAEKKKKLSEERLKRVFGYNTIKYEEDGSPFWSACTTNYTRRGNEDTIRWYDRFNRDNFRRENRWRMRRR